MTTFNYRFVRMDVKYPDEEWYEVHTVHAKDDGSLWSEGLVELSGPGRAEVQHELHLMAADVFGSEPVLESSLIVNPFSCVEYVSVDMLVDEILLEE